MNTNYTKERIARICVIRQFAPFVIVVTQTETKTLTTNYTNDTKVTKNIIFFFIRVIRQFALFVMIFYQFIHSFYDNSSFD